MEVMITKVMLMHSFMNYKGLNVLDSSGSKYIKRFDIN
jgi:hypothetical protein